MRILVLGLASILPAASAAAPAPPASTPVTSTPSVEQPAVLRTPATALPGQKCRRPDVHQAQRDGPPQFKRLDELPDATAYMAVYRTVDGCEEPLTVADYRTGRR